MPSGHFRFQDFHLDLAERRLRRGGELVELNARYFDALAMLVREPGKLVSKDRFLDEAWNGMAVTEEALTQCIRTLRKALGDSAVNPRFIETVPKHGYRFIAEVMPAEAAPAEVATHAAAQSWTWQQALLLAAAGTTGAGVAGVHGGLFYGFAGASQPLAPGMGAVSMLLVMVCLTIVAALAGGAGVSIGIATSTLLPGPRWRWAIAGGALGGGVAGLVGGLIYGLSAAAQPGVGSLSVLLVLTFLSLAIALLGAAGVSLGIAAAGFAAAYRSLWTVVGAAGGGMMVGAVVKLLGLDAFNLLLGQSPGDITGAGEGIVLGASVGFGLWFGARNGRSPWTRRSIVAAAIAGAVAGIAIPLAGGRLMGGSLDLLARTFDGSRLRLDRIGAVFGEAGFGPVSQVATGAMEGALFGACIVGAMVALAPLFAGTPGESPTR